MLSQDFDRFKHSVLLQASIGDDALPFAEQVRQDAFISDAGDGRAVRQLEIHPRGPGNPFNAAFLYKGRNAIERMFCRLKEVRRIATRYNKRADTFLAALQIAAIIA